MKKSPQRETKFPAAAHIFHSLTRVPDANLLHRPSDGDFFMSGRLQTDNASENELVQQLHRWRIAQGYGRAKAVEVFKEKVGFSVSFRTLEKWEQGVSSPSNSAEFLLTQFLEKIKKEK